MRSVPAKSRELANDGCHLFSVKNTAKSSAVEEVAGGGGQAKRMLMLTDLPVAVALLILPCQDVVLTDMMLGVVMMMEETDSH